jgi:hypothetical protein
MDVVAQRLLKGTQGRDPALARTRAMMLVEAKFYPYIVISFRGTGHAEAEYRAMFEAAEAAARRALRERTKCVCISISSGSMSAAERKLVARLIEESPKDLQHAAIGTFVVVQNALFRGIITALRWVAPTLTTLEPVSSVDFAMNRAAEAFRLHRITVGSAETEGARRWLKDQVVRHRNVERASS